MGFTIGVLVLALLIICVCYVNRIRMRACYFRWCRKDVTVVDSRNRDKYAQPDWSTGQALRNPTSYGASAPSTAPMRPGRSTPRLDRQPTI